MDEMVGVWCDDRNGLLANRVEGFDGLESENVVSEDSLVGFGVGLPEVVNGYSEGDAEALEVSVAVLNNEGSD